MLNQVLDPAYNAKQSLNGLGVVTNSHKAVYPNANNIDVYRGYTCDFQELEESGVNTSRMHFTRKPVYLRDNDCETYRNRILETHASISVMLANGYKQIERAYDYREANIRLGRADKLLTVKDIKLSMSDDELIEIAESKARNQDLVIQSKGHTFKTYLQLSNYVTGYQLTPPTLNSLGYYTVDANLRHRFSNVDHDELIGAINRMACPLWWRRNLRVLQVQVIENLARDLRTVHKKASPYVSDFTVYNKRNRKEKTDEMLKDLFVVYDDQNIWSDFESLKDISDKSHTSGTQQAAELMTRIRGFEELAKQYGHTAEFYTLTAPSRFHSVLASGHANKKYDGSNPQDAQAYFNDIWKKARALFAKQNIRPYGFRVVEPHHDGCPHWHMLLFMQKRESIKVRKILRKLCTQDSPSEFKTASTRFKAVYINPAKGSAAGYIAKYITKSIDGSSIKHAECPKAGKINKSPIEVAERVKAWASANNIRQFQQIGGPSVTVWREMRKLGQGATGQCEIANAMKQEFNEELLQSYAIEKVRQAADSSDWAAFCIAMGGIQVKREDQTCRIHYQIPDIIDTITGEISRSQTKYGDKAVNRPVGVMWDALVVITRKGSPTIASKKLIETQRKLMINAVQWIDEAYEMDLLFRPSQEELDFIESCVRQDEQYQCLFADYDALSSCIPYIEGDSPSLDLCH